MVNVSGELLAAPVQLYTKGRRRFRLSGFQWLWASRGSKTLLAGRGLSFRTMKRQAPVTNQIHFAILPAVLVSQARY